MWIPDLSGREGPKYLQIVEAMAEDIASGRLPAGTRLLPHRELAYQLDMSPNTTSRAYAEAVKRALLKGEVGRGTFVRSTDGNLGHEEPQTMQRPISGPVDLSRNLPLSGFAEQDVRRILGDIATSTEVPALLDYQTDAHLEKHRKAGKVWLAENGLDCDPDCIVPVIGGQHGILSALMALLQPGDLLLTEALTYSPVLGMAARLGLKTASVAMDDNGVIPASFEDLCRNANPRAFYLTPTLQAPTTVTLPAARRAEIGETARRHDVIVIEDDVFGLLKRDKPAPIAHFAPDQTIYITSLSKTVAPGLRVGFLAAPTRFVPALHQAINLSVWMTPPTNLEIAHRLIKDGTASKLAQMQRQTALRRQQIVFDILGEEIAEAPGDGFHIWLRLPEGWRADVFCAECARLGVLINEGRSFAAEAHDAPEAVRICISHELSEDRLRHGLGIIASVLQMLPSQCSAMI
ncbi:PLP-dependent aminotransferase family protein [Thalassospira sp. UBA1131]|uniref:aminotransferase-like domain-containing protein n=1 Tax=Thalassospira sp. UBA1131 TaxID=1947672 RepID=UPI0025ED3562|nr:PLP-dependent aminotransferase family protein [Thalassospira sp. UBA1131]